MNSNTGKFLAYYFKFIELLDENDEKHKIVKNDNFVEKCKMMSNFSNLFYITYEDLNKLFENNDKKHSINTNFISFLSKTNNKFDKLINKNLILYIKTESNTIPIISYFINESAKCLIPVFYTTLSDLLEIKTKNTFNNDDNKIFDLSFIESKLIIIDNFNIDLLYGSEKNCKIVENILRSLNNKTVILFSENKVEDFNDVFGKQIINLINSKIYKLTVDLKFNCADKLIEEL